MSDMPRDLSKLLFDLPKKATFIDRRSEQAQQLFDEIKKLVRDPRFKDHPAYGKSYHDVDVDVHGGLTFAGKCQPNCEDHGICHVVEEGESDDIWWQGFDTAHFRDFCPGMHATLKRIMPGENSQDDPSLTYKDVAYVENEIRSLAQQLAAMR